MIITRTNKKPFGEGFTMQRGNKTGKEVTFKDRVNPWTVARYQPDKPIPRDDVELSIARYYGKSVDSIFFN